MGENKKVIVQNVNVPNSITRVNADKYYAMKEVFLNILPSSTPGLTQKEIQLAVIPHLPQTLFPEGATSAWWAKTVQLDLEAQGIVKREKSNPLRWHKQV